MNNLVLSWLMATLLIFTSCGESDNTNTETETLENAKKTKCLTLATITLYTKKRYELCLEADQIIATEVPIIPLWHHETY